jgi:hypothetical protein
LGDFEEGKKWKENYISQRKNVITEGLDEYFNFDYFTFENKIFGIWL